MPTYYSGKRGVPGIMPAERTQVGQVWAGAYDYNKSFFRSSHVSGSSRDPGNTPTTLLRPGLLMGKRSAGNATVAAGELVQWDPAATDGSEVIYAILTEGFDTQMNGQDLEQYRADMLISGYVKSSEICDPASSTKGIVGSVNEAAIRAGLSASFILDDQPGGALDNGSSIQVGNETRVLTMADSGNTYILTDAGAELQLPDVSVQSALGWRIKVIGQTGGTGQIVETTGGSLLGLANVAVNTTVTIRGITTTEFLSE